MIECLIKNEDTSELLITEVGTIQIQNKHTLNTHSKGELPLISRTNTAENQEKEVTVTRMLWNLDVYH